ncbi:hypothetical protein BD626DRAFT_475998 [Schizophyllum amplum]|uniref:Uncharacterized protein n=1 Tax=Schizophyllum amplum TaxID=97359 RepID=A0A550CYX8_9AGAR|nr:hypothetical protein BD626DRAFT_475998 [Auriculariopsis ampla]
MTVAMQANASGTNMHPSRGRSQGGSHPPVSKSGGGGLLRSISGVFKKDEKSSSRPRRAQKDDFTNKESREAALRAYGLLPPPDMSAQESQRDKSTPPSPDPSHARTDSLSTAERIKQEWKAKTEAENQTRMQAFKFGGSAETSPVSPPSPVSEHSSEESDSRWPAQKSEVAAAEVVFPKRAAPASANHDSARKESSPTSTSPVPPPTSSPTLEMKTERRRGPALPPPQSALPLPPPTSTEELIAKGLSESLSRRKPSLSPNLSVVQGSPTPPPSSLPPLPERDTPSSSPDASESPVTPLSEFPSPPTAQPLQAPAAPADTLDDAALQIIIDAYDYLDPEEAIIPTDDPAAAEGVKRSWSRARRPKPPPSPSPSDAAQQQEGAGGGVRRRKTLNPFRRGAEDGEAPAAGKFSRSKSLMRPRGEGRSRARNRSVDDREGAGRSQSPQPERTPVAPTIHRQGSVMQGVHAIKDEESRALTEMAFM